MVTMQMHHDLAAYKTLPLTGYEKVAAIHQLTITQYKYIDAIRTLGRTVGQRISQPRRHRPPSTGLIHCDVRPNVGW